MSRMRMTALFLLAIAAWVLSLTDAENVQAALPEYDIEATRDYIIYNEDRTLVRYDPVTGERHMMADVLESKYSHFIVSSEGMIAFDRTIDGEKHIYVVDSSDPNSSVYPMQPTMKYDGWPAWSLDGQYLAFSAEDVESDARQLHLWDGEYTINITPDDLTFNPRFYYVAWSMDGRLAFVVSDGSSNNSELYIWDGHQAFSISQGIDASVWRPIWSRNGKLMFDDGSDDNIFVWQGRADDDHSLASDEYINISLEGLSHYQSAAAWTPDDDITFLRLSQEYGATHAYLWDGSQSTDIIQIYGHASSNLIWNNYNQYAFYLMKYPFALEEIGVIVRDSEHNTLLFANGTQAAWGANGYLTFCKTLGHYPFNWQLHMWDGTGIQEIYTDTDDLGQNFHAFWQKTGQGFYCTNG